MKRYAVADEVPEDCDYLTAGKEYEVIAFLDSPRPLVTGRIFEFKSDHGALSCAMELSCLHLEGKSWRIVERE